MTFLVFSVYGVVKITPYVNICLNSIHTIPVVVVVSKSQESKIIQILYSCELTLRNSVYTES